MVGTMSSDTRKAWTKTDSEDASRLLAGLVRRAEKSRPGAESAPEFQSPAEFPVAGDGGPESIGGVLLSGPVTVASSGGDSGDGSEIADGGGRLCSGVFRLRNANDDRPPDRENIVLEDRARCTGLVTLPAVKG